MTTEEHWKNLNIHSSNCNKHTRKFPEPITDLWKDLIMWLEDNPSDESQQYIDRLLEIPFALQTEFMIQGHASIIKPLPPSAISSMRNYGLSYEFKSEERLLLGHIYRNHHPETFKNNAFGTYAEDFGGKQSTCFAIGIDILGKIPPRFMIIHQRQVQTDDRFWFYGEELNDTVKAWMVAVDANEPVASSNGWALKKVEDMADDHVMLWDFICAIYKRPMSDKVEKCLLSGPLREFVNRYIVEYIGRIKAVGESDERFRSLFQKARRMHAEDKNNILHAWAKAVDADQSIDSPNGWALKKIATLTNDHKGLWNFIQAIHDQPMSEKVERSFRSSILSDFISHYRGGYRLRIEVLMEDSEKFRQLVEDLLPEFSETEDELISEWQTEHGFSFNGREFEILYRLILRDHNLRS